MSIQVGIQTRYEDADPARYTNNVVRFVAEIGALTVEVDRPETVVVDEDYIKTSIVNPMSQIAQGYAPVMPAYATLSEEELDAITDYIKTLSD